MLVVDLWYLFMDYMFQNFELASGWIYSFNLLWTPIWCLKISEIVLHTSRSSLTKYLNLGLDVPKILVTTTSRSQNVGGWHVWNISKFVSIYMQAESEFYMKTYIWCITGWIDRLEYSFNKYGYNDNIWLASKNNNSLHIEYQWVELGTK